MALVTEPTRGWQNTRVRGFAWAHCSAAPDAVCSLVLYLIAAFASGPACTAGRPDVRSARPKAEIRSMLDPEDVRIEDVPGYIQRGLATRNGVDLTLGSDRFGCVQRYAESDIRPKNRTADRLPYNVPIERLRKVRRPTTVPAIAASTAGVFPLLITSTIAVASFP